MPPELAAKLKAQSKLERRSVSALVQIAAEDKLRADDRRRP